MKKIKLLALFCSLVIALSAFVACDHEDKVTGDETIDTKETTVTEETVNAEETTVTEETVDTEETTGTEETVNTEETTGTEETADTKETTGTEETVNAEETTETEETVDVEETTETDTMVDEHETTVTGETDKSPSSDVEKNEVDFENLSQKELYEYICDVVVTSSEQERISVYYRQIWEDEQDGLYSLFVDRTNGWKAYEPSFLNEGGSWYKESNGEYIYYAKDKVVDWDTMEKISYRQVLTEEGIDWEVDLFASAIGLCNHEDMDNTGFMHVIKNHDCDIEITKTEEKITIKFVPLEPRFCDVCENYYSQVEYYECTIIDGLISNTTVSYGGGYAYAFDVTYRCASFDVPSDEECPLRE